MQPTAQPTLQLKVFRTLWGVTTPWQQTLSELKASAAAASRRGFRRAPTSGRRWPGACRSPNWSISPSSSAAAA
ncbi:Uncharacterised protein [Raoultella terrigena]|uniref:Uncharacterized protein n=1 Tax=Raoultella terrigena TaxID=577 RepID=A0A4V6J1P8_RAOTE|nr:Uncharacterised protein [Raoultella terrigena]